MKKARAKRERRTAIQNPPYRGKYGGLGGKKHVKEKYTGFLRQGKGLRRERQKILWFSPKVPHPADAPCSGGQNPMNVVQVHLNRGLTAICLGLCLVFFWCHAPLTCFGQGSPSPESEPVRGHGGGDAEGSKSSSPRSPQPGDDVLVVLDGGDRIEGELVRSDEQSIGVRIAGVVVSFDRGRIERMVVLDPPEVRYRRLRASIADDDVEHLVMLAEWLQRRRMFREALVELDTALKADPTHAEAIRLKRIVAELAALAERRGPADGADRERERAEAGRFPSRPAPGEFPLLTPEEINLIKVYEIDLRDPPKVIVPRSTILRLLNEYGDDPLIPGTREGREAFLRKDARDILDVMFRLRARDLYGQVTVLDHPRSMRLFRDQVHAAWLVNSCASTRCHGGSDGGRLRLYNYRPTAAESVYTNFLILERFTMQDGKRLIDYDEPERSPLLQMGLPRDDARTPHPVVRGWSPIFRNRDARRFVQGVEWIRSMYRPRPDYPIEYPPPSAKETGGVPPAEPVER